MDESSYYDMVAAGPNFRMAALQVGCRRRLPRSRQVLATIEDLCAGAIRLEPMDRVRFGRALGMCTREAAKALARVADAALAPNPRSASGPTRSPVNRVQTRSPQSAPPQSAPPQSTPPQSARRAPIPSREDLRRGGRQFQAGVLKPFAKASSVLWFEFTGSFFGLFAVAMAVETWKRRADLRHGVLLSGHAWLAPALFVVFCYFTVSSFVRARRRSRR